MPRVVYCHLLKEYFFIFTLFFFVLPPICPGFRPRCQPFFSFSLPALACPPVFSVSAIMAFLLGHHAYFAVPYSAFRVAK